MTSKKPRELKVLRGTLRPDRDRPGIKCQGELGPPPQDLTEEARKFWRTYGPELEALGIVGSVDRAAFGHLAHLHALLVRLERELLEGDLVIEGPRGGRSRSPAATLYIRCLRQYESLAKNFGLLPHGRRGLGAQTPPAPDEFDRWLKAVDGGKEKPGEE